MKKIAHSLMLLILLLSLAACSSTPAAKAEMSIQKTDLTADEQALLELVGTEHTPYILTYAVDDTVQSLQINAYELQGNQWHLLIGGGGQELSEPNGRIALTFDNIGQSLRIAVENKGANSYIANNDFDFSGLSTTTSYLTDPTPIVYDQEIPLVIQIHTAQDTVSSLFPEFGFHEPQTYADLGYEKVYAITCLFSQQSVHQLSAASSQ